VIQAHFYLFGEQLKIKFNIIKKVWLKFILDLMLALKRVFMKSDP